MIYKINCNFFIYYLQNPGVVMSGFFAHIGVSVCGTNGCNGLGDWHTFIFDIDGTLHPCRLCVCDWCKERVQTVAER